MVRSILISLWPLPGARLSLTAPRKDKVTLSLQPRVLESTSFVSITRCPLLLKRWLISRLLCVADPKRPLAYPSTHHTWQHSSGTLHGVLILPFVTRLRTSNATSFLLGRAQVRNKPPPSKNPYINCLRNCRPSPATRSTSVRVKTAISVLFAVPSAEFSISAWLRVWWWFQWPDCRSLLCASFSKALERVRYLRQPVSRPGVY